MEQTISQRMISNKTLTKLSKLITKLVKIQDNYSTSSKILDSITKIFLTSYHFGSNKNKINSFSYCMLEPNKNYKNKFSI